MTIHDYKAGWGIGAWFGQLWRDIHAELPAETAKPVHGVVGSEKPDLSLREMRQRVADIFKMPAPKRISTLSPEENQRCDELQLLLGQNEKDLKRFFTILSMLSGLSKSEDNPITSILGNPIALISAIQLVRVVRDRGKYGKEYYRSCLEYQEQPDEVLESNREPASSSVGENVSQFQGVSAEVVAAIQPSAFGLFARDAGNAVEWFSDGMVATVVYDARLVGNFLEKNAAAFTVIGAFVLAGFALSRGNEAPMEKVLAMVR